MTIPGNASTISIPGNELDQKLYGLTPEIAKVSCGCHLDFLLKKKPGKAYQEPERINDEEPVRKQLKKRSVLKYSFNLEHGSLILVMRGHTHRDWLHSVPKRPNAEGSRISLTFRLVL
ncbi:hypothetical protein FEM48_Zijuj01G0088800 [Ziziphus jujuba var. spinosa]|uniref:Alpha-ketoglutarate-dependent dioxygenase AlkB-like domain-containing protein n=1 Tax=Ziziphus jujuba var. spinosa TaxID=714518 RepID=A0A978W0A9_ZIZJJ|nr:hypothetical protein FEM48_Zijuj01G0088800 [Ziziphus jujuba var. spinosa]